MARPCGRAIFFVTCSRTNERKVLFPHKYRTCLFSQAPWAYRLAARGCEVLFASYPGGTETPAHTRDTDNVGVITQGQLILDMGGVIKRFGTGDWYHVPANVEHAARLEIDTAEFEFWFEVVGAG